MCAMWFLKSPGARMTSRICGWAITPVIVRFTAPVRLWGYVDGSSRGRGDSPARFFGEGVIALSPPYPTSYPYVAFR
jgi:hypothetical protein